MPNGCAMARGGHHRDAMHQKFAIALAAPIEHDPNKDIYLNRRGTWTDEQAGAIWFRRMADAAAFRKKTRDEIVRLADRYSGNNGARAALLTSVDWTARASLTSPVKIRLRDEYAALATRCEDMRHVIVVIARRHGADGPAYHPEREPPAIIVSAKRALLAYSQWRG
jgi:hypothetical protein